MEQEKKKKTELWNQGKAVVWTRTSHKKNYTIANRIAHDF